MIMLIYAAVAIAFLHGEWFRDIHPVITLPDLSPNGMVIIALCTL